MEYSNEAISLVESVLNESKAYRKFSSQVQDKGEELMLNYQTAKAEGNQEKINKAAIALKKFNDSLAKYGTPYPVRNSFGGKSSEIYDKTMAEMLGSEYKRRDKEFKQNTGSTRSKNPHIDSNINNRTRMYDTTHSHDVKKEAAMILIEALNTLLNE